jgi:CBS-domain-containing membrane protein
MLAHELPLVPVVEAGRLVGVLTQDDVTQGLRLYRLHRPGAAWPGARVRPRTA